MAFPPKPFGRQQLRRIALSLLITIPALRLRRFALCSQLLPRAPCGFLAGPLEVLGKEEYEKILDETGTSLEHILAGDRNNDASPTIIDLHVVAWILGQLSVDESKIIPPQIEDKKEEMT